MIKLACRSLGIRQFLKKKVTWSQKSLSKSVNWSKCSTLSPEEYYFKDTIKRLSESDFIANTSKFFKYYASLTVYIHKYIVCFFKWVYGPELG